MRTITTFASWRRNHGYPSRRKPIKRKYLIFDEFEMIPNESIMKVINLFAWKEEK